MDHEDDLELLERMRDEYAVASISVKEGMREAILGLERDVEVEQEALAAMERDIRRIEQEELYKEN